MATRRKQKRRKRIRIADRFTVVGISTVAGLLIVAVLILTHQEQQIYSANSARDQELQAESEKESERTKEIEELKEKIKTDEYIEEIAIEKLGLVPKDEIIFEEEN